MKNLILILSIFIFGSCGPSANEKTLIDGFTVVKIDSYEYIKTSVYAGCVLTHKANCKNH